MEGIVGDNRFPLPAIDPLGLLERAWDRFFPDAPVRPRDPLREILSARSRPQQQAEPPLALTQNPCQYGMECIRDHLLRAHLYMTEALRFSSEGTITEAAQEKVRLARSQLLCEDDFARALESAPARTRAEVLRLLASARSTWKAIERSGVDEGFGSVDDLQELAESIQALYRRAYEIDREYRLAVVDAAQT
ncbi:MAG: hypothetical protein KKC03_13730 [Bacteroidetes bacterium]|nr:hypothetical protein [Bacteroidota bacterium]